MTCFNCEHCTEDGFDYDYAGGYGFCGSGEYYCSVTRRGIWDGYSKGNAKPCGKFKQRARAALTGRPMGADVIDTTNYEVYEEVAG